MLERQNTHMYGIDLIRFSAAILVLLNHFASYSKNEASVTMVRENRSFDFLFFFEGIGAIGVQVFFVISGLVISMSAMHLSGSKGALRFAFARAIRLLPALWVSGVISVVALIAAGFEIGPLLNRFVRSAVLSPIGPYIDGVVWSLVVEAVFYFVIGVAILLNKPLPIIKIAIFIGVLSSTYLVIFFGSVVMDNQALIGILGRFPFKVFLLRYGVYFAIGMLIWSITNRKDGLVVRLALLFFFAMALLEIWIVAHLDKSVLIFSIMIWIFAMACLAFSIKSRRTPNYPKAYRFLGEMSYPIYLNHYTTGMASVFLLNQIGVTGILCFVLSLFLVIGASYVVLLAERKIRYYLVSAPSARIPYTSKRS
jgi:peptidoglycan/LPS O-acetylase OafA/YrhL